MRIGVTAETVLAMFELLAGNPVIDAKRIYELSVALETESDFADAVNAIMRTRAPEEKVVLALLFEEGKIEDASKRYDAVIRDAGNQMAEKLRTKGGLFAAVDTSIAINAYARLLGIAKTEVHAYRRVATLLKQTGDLARADRWFREMLDLPDLDDENRARVASELADLAAMQHDVPSAMPWYEQALALYTKLGDRLHASHEAKCLANYARQAGDLEAAERYGQQWVQLEARSSLSDAIVNALCFLADVALDRDRVGHADRLANEALDHAKRLNYPETLGHAWSAMTDVAIRQGKTKDALDFVARSVHHYVQAKSHFKLATQLRLMGNLLYDADSFEDAATSYEQARISSERMGDRDGTAVALYCLALTYLMRNDPNSAEPRLRAALEIFSAMNNQGASADVMFRIGDIAAARGKVDEAREFWMKALVRYNNVGDRDSDAAAGLRKRLSETM